VDTALQIPVLPAALVVPPVPCEKKYMRLVLDAFPQKEYVRAAVVIGDVKFAEVTRYDDPLRLNTFPYVASFTIAGDPDEVSV